MTWAALVLVAAVTTPAPAASGDGAPPARAGSSADHWTPERRAAAMPRDLVVGARGEGYLRRPDGTLEPYGHPAAPAAKPQAPGGGSSDTAPPTITVVSPTEGDSIPASHTFTAEVTDASGVRSVTFVIVHPNGATQSFVASATGASTYSATLSGFSDGVWAWYVVAKDAAKKGGNTAQSDPVSFTVASSGGGSGGGGGGGEDDEVVNAPWTAGGAVQTAAGRLYFEMPTNWRKTRWVAYVCSATTVTDATVSRSIILTAAHCVYDDANKAFARNVLFIPDQAASGTASDANCDNDTYGCWEPSFGVVDAAWAARVWPANIPWDYGFYVVADQGAHRGPGTDEALDALASLAMSLNDPQTGVVTAALGYSYSDDPQFMHCQENLGTDASAGGWFLPGCGLSGGASGGPWLQPVNGGNGTIVSVNSYGYSNQPGMGGPKLSGSTACLFERAKSAPLGSIGITETC